MLAQDQLATLEGHPSLRSLRGLDWLYFFLADIQTGVGPFLAVYLASQRWNPEQVGIALTIGGLAGVFTQIPAGGVVDRAHRKRLLILGALIALAAGALLLALWPKFAVVVTAQILIGATSAFLAPYGQRDHTGAGRGDRFRPALWPRPKL